jgi:hypothetical protein
MPNRLDQQTPDWSEGTPGAIESAMRISLAKHGGQAAGMLLGRPPRFLDMNTLPPPVGEELARLLEAAKATSKVPDAGPGRARDAMSYTITVEDRNHQTVLRRSDSNMSSEFAALLTWLERHMK